MSKITQVYDIINRIVTEINMAEIYPNSTHFNQARVMLTQDLPVKVRELQNENLVSIQQKVKELERECVANTSQTE